MIMLVGIVDALGGNTEREDKQEAKVSVNKQKEIGRVKATK